MFRRCDIQGRLDAGERLLCWTDSTLKQDQHRRCLVTVILVHLSDRLQPDLQLGLSPAWEPLNHSGFPWHWNPADKSFLWLVQSCENNSNIIITRHGLDSCPVNLTCICIRDPRCVTGGSRVECPPRDWEGVASIPKSHQTGTTKMADIALPCNGSRFLVLRSTLSSTQTEWVWDGKTDRTLEYQ